MNSSIRNYVELKKNVTNYSVKNLGRVAVIMGGIAAEREVSLNSGKAVFEALKSQGVKADLLDITSINQLIELSGKYDRVFNIIHGRWGEDGGVQAVLDAIEMPYTGSGMAASALAMDKLRTKWLWQGLGLSTPSFMVVSEYLPFVASDFTMDFPVIVKPVREGSSIGMRKANNLQELTEAIIFAQQYDSEILIEKWVTGREFTCAVVDGIALPLIELKTDHEFYDFDAKYKSNNTEYLCPVSLDESLEIAMKLLSVQAFDSVGCQDWGRVDLMLDEKNQAWLIEVNTVPGMTDHSLVPMAAKAVDLSFGELVVWLLSLTVNND